MNAGKGVPFREKSSKYFLNGSGGTHCYVASKPNPQLSLMAWPKRTLREQKLRDTNRIQVLLSV